MIRLTLTPDFRLTGLPDRISTSQLSEFEFPPCPACGRAIEVEFIDVSTWGEPEPVCLAGTWSCPSGCDPRFRRIVIARDHQDFRAFCHDRNWNPRVVKFIRADDRADQWIRGCLLHPGMTHVTDRAEPSPRLHHEIQTRINFGEDYRITAGHPFRTDLISDQRPTYEEPEADPFSWCDAYRWIPG